jgi:hypothetical protein
MFFMLHVVALQTNDLSLALLLAHFLSLALLLAHFLSLALLLAHFLSLEGLICHPSDPCSDFSMRWCEQCHEVSTLSLDPTYH